MQLLIGCAQIGYAKTRSQSYCFSKSYGGTKKKNKTPDEVSLTMGWWYSFKSRHPQFTVQTASRLAYCRAVAQDSDVISNYFDLLEETLLKNGLYNDANRIYNCDKSGFPLDHEPGKVVGEKGLKDLSVATSGDKAQLTVLACVSASGHILPPLVMFDRKRLKPEHTEGQVIGTIYGLSKSGWIDSEIFGETVFDTCSPHATTFDTAGWALLTLPVIHYSYRRVDNEIFDFLHNHSS